MRGDLIQCLSVDAPEWKHPWQVTPRWDEELGQWLVYIEPGFVDARDVTLPTPKLRASLETRERWMRDGVDDTAYLVERSPMVLGSMRAIGPDAAPTSAQLNDNGELQVTHEAVPEFFENLGVGKPPRISEGDLGLEQTPDEPNSRLLRAIEIVLYKDRLANSSQIVVDEGSDGTLVEFGVTYTKSGVHRDLAYIRTTPRIVPTVDTDPLQKLTGQWDDEPREVLHLATVYFVSPPNMGYGSEPDARWLPYVQHHVFWNVAFGTNAPDQALKSEPLQLTFGLLGGLGDALINALFVQINDATLAFAQWFNRAEIKGKFWTV